MFCQLLRYAKKALPDSAGCQVGVDQKNEKKWHTFFEKNEKKNEKKWQVDKKNEFLNKSSIFQSKDS